MEEGEAAIVVVVVAVVEVSEQISFLEQIRKQMR